MLAPNTVLQDRYQIVRLLGKGGMGAVYLARDRRLGHSVALKETFFNNEMLLRAFEREARLLAGLRHAALPKVSDHFTEGAGQFLVMEFIPGDDLGDMLQQRGRAFSPNQVLNWADQLLDALDYLHSHEPPIIHRDIKPQNLKLAERDQIILLDFGLAKGLPAQSTQAATGRSLFGYTPDYAPLEQIQGEGTNPRSDLYSLAATLYHLMTGLTPPGALARVSAVGGGQPDPLRRADQINPQITPDVASILMWAMSLYSNQRPATAAVMRQALRDATDSGASTGGGRRDYPGVAPTVIASPQTNFSPPPVPTSPPSTPQGWSASGGAISHQPYSPPARKSNAVWWVMGGLGGLIILGVIGAIIAYFVFNQGISGKSSMSETDSGSVSGGKSSQVESPKTSDDSGKVGKPDDATTPGTDSGELSVDRILDRYVQALGGREAIESVTSRAVRGSFEIPDLGLAGTTESYAKAPNKLLVIINVPGLGVTRSGFDGRTGWSEDPQGGLRALTGAELAAMRRDADFYRDIKLKQLYARMTFAGKERVKGREAYVIEADPPEGGADKMYFDAESGILLRNDTEREGLQGLMAIESYFENHRTVDGINLPFVLRQSSSLFNVVIRIREVRHNVSISDARFNMPSSR